MALATVLVWRIFLDFRRYFSVPIVLANRPLALPLVLSGPVCLLAVLAAVGRVPAAPVDSLRLALITLSRKYLLEVKKYLKKTVSSNKFTAPY